MKTENDPSIQKHFDDLKAADRQKMTSFQETWDQVVAIQKARGRMRKVRISLVAASVVLAIFVGPDFISKAQNAPDLSIFYADSPSDFLLEPAEGSISNWESPTDFLLHSTDFK